MFKAFSALQPVDYLVNRTGNGAPALLLMVVTTFPVVSYNEDGTIDGANSYVYVTYISGTPMMRNGMMTSWVCDYKRTFNDLDASMALPVTCQGIAEGVLPVPAATFSMSAVNDGTSIIENSGLSGNLNSNYRIFMVDARIADNAGQTVRNVTVYPPNVAAGAGTVMVSKSFNLTGLNTQLDIDGLNPGDYTFVLEAYAAGESNDVLQFSFTVPGP